MNADHPVRLLFAHTDWSNHALLDAASGFDDERLDRDLHIGLGSLRRNMLHIYHGESVWLERWRGNADTHWPSQEPVPMRRLAEMLRETARNRDEYLESRGDAQLREIVEYRDSSGDRFRATREHMILQLLMHTKHHQAQSANMIRRLGGDAPELDYMYRIRESV